MTAPYGTAIEFPSGTVRVTGPAPMAEVKDPAAPNVTVVGGEETALGDAVVAMPGTPPVAEGTTCPCTARMTCSISSSVGDGFPLA